MSEKNPTVKTIIEDYLKAHGFDGLWSFDGECACKVGDLFPCEEPGVERCEAGYVIPCCHDGEHAWDIGRKPIEAGPREKPRCCDHKFIDSLHCLKCGWTAPAVEGGPQEPTS